IRRTCPNPAASGGAQQAPFEQSLAGKQKWWVVKPMNFLKLNQGWLYVNPQSITKVEKGADRLIVTLADGAKHVITDQSEIQAVLAVVNPKPAAPETVYLNENAGKPVKKAAK